MQSLSGKLAALNRFLSKSAERSLPFLDMLKKCTNKKDFRWTEAAEAAFLEMKKLVSELPTLATPKKGETLMMYLAASNKAVSTVLLTKRDGRQMPIHYVSRSLQGVETNYALIEKLALALVHAARRLRRYFQAHLIKVITDSPTEQVLNNLGASGRLAKWAIELGAYGITYVPRVAIKGQVLAEFLVDTPTKINATPEVKDIHAFVDSKLVANQVEGSYEAKGERMIKYQERKADALSKLVAVQFDHLSKEVLVEVLNERSVEAQEVNMVVEEEGPTWMTPIRNYLEKGKLPEDPVDARTLMEKIRNYTMEDGVLYRKSYLVLLMRCVGPLQANYIIREVHMGSCRMHDGPRQVVAKAMNLGYYCPSMHRDARELIRACDDCQAHVSVPRLPKADMISVTSAWPFMKWGIDIVGPLPKGLGRVKYLIVAIDYFTKWMEAKPLATITGKQVVSFTYDNIVCGFRIPAIIITDNGTRFVNDPFKKWAEKLKIQLISTLVYHPQGNGTLERANKILLIGIKTRLEKGGSAWAKEVPNMLWANQTMKKTSNDETLSSLTMVPKIFLP
ncbi:reverse transcriptase domain-containing protein [Tanacetum coccineum]|uniref:Reverse transcriptase domain-containing protein n=1 Tax=Tanacetum coccineum TaxID=301880 RepID=A0ABQ4YM33_9ASTR